MNRTPSTSQDEVSILDLVDDSYIRLDDEFRCTFANRAAERLLGKSRGELLGNVLWEDYSASVGAPLEVELSRAMTGRVPVAFENWNQARQRWHAITVTPDSGGGIVVHFADITARKLAEQALARSEAEMKAIHDHAPVMMCVVDAERRVLHANPAFAAFTGVAEEELKGGRACGVFGCINALEHPRGCGHGTNCQDCALRLALEDTLKTGIGHHGVEWHATWAREGNRRKVALLGSTALIYEAGQKQLLLCLQDITERRRAEDGLRRERLMLAQTERVANVGSWQWDVATDTVTWSDELFRIFQRDPREGAPSFAQHAACYPPDGMARLRQAVEAAVAEGTPYELELRAIRKDGETRDCVARGVAERAPDGRVVRLFGSCQDITERKRAEEALRESELRYRTLADSGEALIWTSGLDKKCDYFNQPWLNFTGRSLDQELGDGWAESVHPEDRERCMETYSRAFDRRERFSMDYRLRRHDGEYRWMQDDGMPRLDSHGKFLGYIGHCLDITRRKRAEQDVRESEQRYRSLFENMLEGFAYLQMLYDEQNRPVDFVYLEVNNAFEQLTGLRDVAGRRVSQVIPGIRESNPELLEIYGRAALNGTREKFEIYIATLGQWRSSSVYGVGEGRCVVVFEDITGRKLEEADREALMSLLRLLNVPNRTHELVRAVTALLQEWSGCEAVGIRLREGDDFPYFETRGFPAEFVQAENYLCVRDAKQEVLRDSQGNAVLECMCGNVLCGRFDPALPFFTTGGSFWTNSTSKLLASTTEADRQARTRNRCNGEGHESVALVPLRSTSGTIGLLQVNDRHPDRFTPEKIALLERLSASLAIALEQRMTQAALCESEERYRLISENMSDVIWLLDVASGRLTYVSPSVERLLGYSPEEILAKGLPEILTPASYQYVTSRLPQVLEAFENGDESMRTQSSELDQLRKDGSVVRTEVATTLLANQEGRVVEILGTSRDITKRVEVLQTLRESEEAHRALVEGLPDVVIRFDRDGRHLFVSDNIRQVVNLQAAEFIGKTHRELGFSEAQSRFWDDAIRRVFDSGTPFETEFTLESRQGPSIHNWRLLPERDAQGRVRSVLSLSRDITAHRRAEEDYRTLFREMMDGFAVHEIICDDEGRPADYRFLDVNPAFERMTGLKSQDVLGRTVLEVMPNTERFWIESYGRVALTGEPASFEHIHSELKKHFEVKAFRPAANQFACIFGDITERKALEVQLQQAQKMESIGRLAGGIAHDFNNLLTVINGYSQLLFDKMSVEDPIRAHLGEIHKAGERAAGLTRQLLAFSRKQVLELRVLDLNGVVTGMRPMLERLMGEDVEVRVALKAGTAMVRADPHQLEQVVMNLAVNARDAMPGGGRLLIETAGVEWDEADAQAHPEAGAGRYVMLSVSDNGAGMDEQTRQQIFEPFFTTKGTGKGTGLGLSMVQGIVAQSGGCIEVYSEPGQGATFKIYLPALTDAATDAGMRAANPALGGGETVLVVEDQAEVREYVTTVLKSYGYHVITAEHAGGALQLARSERRRIHLLLTDVVMPELSGRELATELRKLQPGIKVLFMSGYSDEAIVHHGVLDECGDFIQKPFSPEVLAGKLRAVLGPPKPLARILVADDDAAVRGFLRKVLEQDGYQVTEAADGKQALQQALTGRVDLVITDIVMPEQEGIETIRALRQDLPDVAIIAISGAFDGQFLNIAKLMGAAAVLTKPVTAELLLSKVAEVLASRR